MVRKNKKKVYIKKYRKKLKPKSQSTTKQAIVSLAIIAAALGYVHKDFVKDYSEHLFLNIKGQKSVKQVIESLNERDYSKNIFDIEWKLKNTWKDWDYPIFELYMHKQTGVLALTRPGFRHGYIAKVDIPKEINKIQIDAYIPKINLRKDWNLCHKTKYGGIYQNKETDEFAYICKLQRIRQITNNPELIDLSKELNYLTSMVIDLYIKKTKCMSHMKVPQRKEQ